jgi:RHS repeat-associated protein
MVGSNDLVMGSWTFTPDTLNRLSSATNLPVSSSATNYYCWSYDSFGNRSLQGVSTAAFASGPPACTPQSSASYEGVWAHIASNNRFSNTQQAMAGVAYDGAGNILNDGVNQYLYDGEGRICAAATEGSGPPVMTGYIYNAEGQRVGKGTITSWSCDPTANGYQAMSDFILGPSGEQVTEMGMKPGVGMAWQHTNVYALGQLIATYDNNGLHFYLNDSLGTRRAQTDYAGVLEQTCASLPFGDALNCTNSLQSPTEHHFTGKERDTESGLDYFGARYYASNMGRFMSPDSGADATLGVPVPFADLENPQSLNLYGYVHNNPLRFTDPDGHATWADCGDGSGSQCLFGDYNGEANQQNGRTVYWNAANGNWDNNDPTKMNDGRVNDLSGGQLLMAVPLGKLVGPLVGSAMSKASEALTNALGRTGEAAAETGAKTLLSGSNRR